MSQSFYQTPEFRRTANNAADTGIKLFFRWFSWGLLGFIRLVKEMLYSVIGK